MPWILEWSHPVKLDLEELQHWVEGATYPFIIYADHRNLKWLRTVNAQTPYSPNTPFFKNPFLRPGSENTEADAMSCQYFLRQIPPVHDQFYHLLVFSMHWFGKWVNRIRTHCHSISQRGLLLTISSSLPNSVHVLLCRHILLQKPEIQLPNAHMSLMLSLKWYRTCYAPNTSCRQTHVPAHTVPPMALHCHGFNHWHAQIPK